MSSQADLQVSQARVVGRIEPPPGLSWDDVLTRPAVEALCIAEFCARSARVLGISASRVRAHHIRTIRSPGKPEKPPRRWHHDWFEGLDQAQCVLGVSPTEYLLGEFSRADTRTPEGCRRIEDRLTLWVPQSGDLFLTDAFRSSNEAAAAHDALRRTAQGTA